MEPPITALRVRTVPLDGTGRRKGKMAASQVSYERKGTPILVGGLAMVDAT